MNISARHLIDEDKCHAVQEAWRQILGPLARPRQVSAGAETNF